MSGEGGERNEWIAVVPFAVVDLAPPAFPTPRARTVVVEGLLTKAGERIGMCQREAVLLIEATMTQVLCQVGSKTDRPCPHQAVVKIRGIPFCERCAREQEAYFAIGEVTQEEKEEEKLGLRDELLIEEVLDRMRWERTGCISAVEMEKAKVTVRSPE